MMDSKPFLLEHPQAEDDAEAEFEVEADDMTHFEKSLKELSDLRSQLHHAADYCEATFLNATQKQRVIKNTKEYLCRAIVTVVDHLGSVSANLDHQLSVSHYASETELRINCLNQKLATCQQYSHKLALRKLSWNADCPRYHPRYIIPPTPILRRSDAMLRKTSDAPIGKSIITKEASDTKEEVPIIAYKYKPFLVEDSSAILRKNNFPTSVVPVQDCTKLKPKPPHQLFQFQEKHKIKRRMLNWKPVENNDLIAFIKWSKRTT